MLFRCSLNYFSKFKNQKPQNHGCNKQTNLKSCDSLKSSLVLSNNKAGMHEAKLKHTIVPLPIWTDDVFSVPRATHCCINRLELNWEKVTKSYRKKHTSTSIETPYRLCWSKQDYKLRKGEFKDGIMLLHTLNKGHFQKKRFGKKKILQN